jgi:hypothetical protein
MAAKHWQWRHDAIQAVNSAYEAWNSVLAARYFSSAGAGKPVYLSIDDDALNDVLPAVGSEGPRICLPLPFGRRYVAAMRSSSGTSSDERSGGATGLVGRPLHRAAGALRSRCVADGTRASEGNRTDRVLPPAEPSLKPPAVRRNASRVRAGRRISGRTCVDGLTTTFPGRAGPVRRRRITSSAISVGRSRNVSFARPTAGGSRSSSGLLVSSRTQTSRRHSCGLSS